MYQEEEQVRLRRQSSKQAIALAMEGRWREAVAVNKGIVDRFPNDVDAYNRLGRAYMELGEYSLAGEAYRRTQELDPYNTIAQKNLRRLSHLREAVAISEDSSHRVEPQDFIEETVEEFGGDRVLFASGSPYFDQRYEIKRVQLAKVNENKRRAMSSGNACRLLNLQN